MCGPENTPIVNALKKYIDDCTIRFHMPGHKGRKNAHNPAAELLGERVFASDVTNVPGLDDLYQAHGVIKDAQGLAAKTFGADFTYFLVNGSSCGLQALVMTVCRPGDKILVPRNMHRSILSGVILSGAVPVYFKPEYDWDYNIPLGTRPETIDRILDCHPDIKAVMLVNPTYHGITSDVPSIARTVHARNIPLLVDEAHGPHLHFHKDLPGTALEGGADASVQGTHKMLSAFTQASMLHLKGNLIDRQRLEAVLRLLQSTSTSYLLLASLDAARAQFNACGKEMVQEALDLAGYLREKINGIEGYSSFGVEMIGKPGISGLDPTKVVISVRGLQVTGLWAEKWLRENRGIQVEMSDVFNLLLIVTGGNNLSDADSLIKALRDMSDCVRQGGAKADLQGAVAQLNPFPGMPEMVITPREAFWNPVTVVPLQEAAGRICAEVIACYPPGIPVICPGERLTSEIIEYLTVLRNLGMHFQGCYDACLESVRVIK
ncbi:MAG: aminotransferase class I/II-fold pyridoxal phosphate-dependent enzyme [Peptococcaceae bacterium]|nr:aminotransferase class I/II-fold pyridoxal phosphate-dependent enzyme [Peptococcaceae bacterium]